VAAVGLVVAAVAVRGHRTQGRSAFYQNALLGFGLHGLGHIGMSLLTRGYTSGVATSPIIVIPFWLWPTRALNQAGVPNGGAFQPRSPSPQGPSPAATSWPPS